jgi:hypothetical protein
MSQKQQVSLFGKKPRPVQELYNDPAFAYQVGRLQGAMIMAAHWLAMREDPESKQMGEKLNEVSSWFFEERK